MHLFQALAQDWISSDPREEHSSERRVVLGGVLRLLYAWPMRLLRRTLVLLTVLTLMVGNLTVSMVSVMDVAMMGQAAMQADADENAMLGCTDCGRDAVPTSACVAQCFLLPAALAMGISLPAPPAAVPTASLFQIRLGRVPVPELHPPQAAA
jgi:hypothetical protein